MYKVLYERVNADGSTISNFFFQRKVPRFKFHLPSGDKGNSQDSFKFMNCKLRFPKRIVNDIGRNIP